MTFWCKTHVLPTADMGRGWPKGIIRRTHDFTHTLQAGLGILWVQVWVTLKIPEGYPSQSLALGMVYDPGINTCMDSAKGNDHLPHNICPQYLPSPFPASIFQFALFFFFVFFTVIALMHHLITPHFTPHLLSCHVLLIAFCLAFCTLAFSNHRVTEDSHYFSWEGMMSLAHVYPIIFTFPLHSLHCWSTTTHPTNMTSHASLHNCSHMMCLPLLHWTSLTYLMDIWCMIHMFTVSFLVTSCALQWPNQSWIIAPHGQALTIASLWMSLVLTFLITICI